VADSFELKLLSQYWINGSTQLYGEIDDTTSHGDISLKINGVEISGCDQAESDLGINQSAVSLLKSIFNDHQPDEHGPIFYHGCSIITTCPNRIIDFAVVHTDNHVKLDRFKVSGIDFDQSMKKYIDEISITIPTVTYAAQILPFAEQSLDFLSAPNRGINAYDSTYNWEASVFAQLRMEHQDLLDRLRKYLAEPV
jgi:hypothetical protein